MTGPRPDEERPSLASLSGIMSGAGIHADKYDDPILGAAMVAADGSNYQVLRGFINEDDVRRIIDAVRPMIEHELRAENRQLRAAIARVEAIHRPIEVTWETLGGFPPRTETHCAFEGTKPWPCETARALAGSGDGTHPTTKETG